MCHLHPEHFQDVPFQFYLPQVPQSSQVRVVLPPILEETILDLAS
jgi:hypothetical protein